MVGAGASSAVIHARGHEQPCELVRIVSTHRVSQIVEVLNGSCGGLCSIAPPLVHEEFASGIPKASQVDAGGVEKSGSFLHQLRVSIKVERVEVEVRLIRVEGKVPEELVHDSELVRAYKVTIGLLSSWSNLSSLLLGGQERKAIVSLPLVQGERVWVYCLIIVGGILNSEI